MKLMYVKIGIVILIVGLLSACGSQTTETPAASLTEAPTQPPVSTDTAAPTEAAQATEPPAATQPAGQNPHGAPVSFTNDVLPIIQSRCINCHGGDRVEKGLDLKTYADLMSGSENGPVVTAGDAEHSELVALIVSQKMPKRGPKLTPPQVEIITEWVNQGANNN